MTGATATIGTFDRETAVRRSLDEPGRVFACLVSGHVVRDGRSVHLPRRRFALFVVLATGLLMTHEQLLDAGWDGADPPLVETVRNKVYYLRRQLAELGLGVDRHGAFDGYALAERMRRAAPREGGEAR